MSTTIELPPGVEPEYTLAETAVFFRRSVKWVQSQMKKYPVEHTRHGNEIRFTASQVKKLQDQLATVSKPAPVTTGRAKS